MQRSGLKGSVPLRVVAVLLAVSACDAGDAVAPPPVPASVVIAPDSTLLTYLGEVVRFSATVRGGTGGEASVSWSSTDEAVVTVDGSGWVTARGNGTAEVRATAAGVSDAAMVRVEQRVAALRAFGGGQRELAGLRLPESVGVLVQDAGGRPVVGTEVRFAASAGGGTVDPGSVRSDGSGVASAAWTLGPIAGQQRLVASTAGGWEAEIEATAVDPSSVVAWVSLSSGDDQWGVAGRPLAEPVVVQALDGAGQPVLGALVQFTAGAGSVVPGSTRSDSLGLASTVWTLGAALGGQTLAASVAGAPRLKVRATAQPDAGICDRTRAVAEELLRQMALTDCAEVTEEHLAAVVYLALRDKGITGLRSGDFAGIPALQTLLLGDNRLRTLPPNLFSGLGSLYRLDLSSNQLESLPPGMLANLPNLKHLSLDFNHLAKVPLGLNGLTNLEWLALTGNPLAEVAPDLLAGLIRLRNLRLSNVGLETLPPDVFAGLAELEELVLTLNELTSLPAGIFDDLSKLEDLRLSRNRLRELPPDALVRLRNLRLLYLSENELDHLDERVFARLSRLTALNLYGNRLSQLPPGIFSGLSNLEALRLNRNELASLPPGIFSGLTSLNRLQLYGNKLTELPEDLFSGLHALEHLSLYQNRLTELPPGIFGGLWRLKELRLSTNFLTALPPDVFRRLSSLEILHLWGNPGAPFPVPLELARTDAVGVLAPGPASVVLRAPTGAPVSLEVTVSVQSGAASSGRLSVAAGDTASAPLEVWRAAGRSGPVYVSLGQAPAFPPVAFGGLEALVGEPLVLFAPADNHPPTVRQAIPEYWLQAGVVLAEVELASHFTDPDGDSLSFVAASGDAGVVAARVEDGVLVMEPLAEGSAVVAVRGEDPGGLRATLDVPVTVARAPDAEGYNITLIFGDGFSEPEEAAIRRAAARWEEVVTGDLPDVPIDGDFCRHSPGRRLVGRIDDVVIQFSVSREARFRLASAADCAVRESGLPFMGAVHFNRDFFDPDAQETRVYFTALHEIGHVLGIGGDRWYDLLRERTGGDVLLDTHFPGPLAMEAFNEAGGRSYTGGKVPVEHFTRWGRNVHWRRSVLEGEIMVAGGTKLSAITVQALADFGYEVDVSRADPYELPAPDMTAAPEAGTVESLFAGDVIEGPVFLVDEDGNVVRVIGN